MGRIIKEIEIEGQPATALFDTGATYTYVREDLLTDAVRMRTAQPVNVVLGGDTIRIGELCLFQGEIQGLGFFGDAVAVKDLGRADGHDLDAIIGALTMERFEIHLDPKSQELDLEGLRRREFTEY